MKKEIEDEVIVIDLQELEQRKQHLSDEAKEIVAESHRNPTEENLLRAAEAMAGVKRLE